MNPSQAQTAIDLPLRDIHFPDPILWWPPAAGWWAVFIALLLLSITAGFCWHNWRSKRVLRQLRHELEQLQQFYQNSNDAHKTIRKLSVLLRRACISYFPRKQVASLTGKHWLAFLDDICEQPYSEVTGRLLIDGPYQSAKKIESKHVDALFELCAATLNTLHRKGKR